MGKAALAVQGNALFMKIETLSIGLPKKEILNGKEIVTGICKSPVSGPLHLGRLGFDGDGVGDLRYHGGPNKAVCVYSYDHYPYWENLLGTKLTIPAFGENLTVSSLNEDDICIGDIFHLGTAVVQVSQPRQPCNTLASLRGRNDMPQHLTSSGYTGFYLRVLKEGIVAKGDSLILKEGSPAQVSVSFANQIRYHDNKNCAAIDKVLSATALSESWQQSFLKLKEQCR